MILKNISGSNVAFKYKKSSFNSLSSAVTKMITIHTGFINLKMQNLNELQNKPSNKK